MKSNGVQYSSNICNWNQIHSTNFIHRLQKWRNSLLYVAVTNYNENINIRHCEI